MYVKRLLTIFHRGACPCDYGLIIDFCMYMYLQLTQLDLRVRYVAFLPHRNSNAEFWARQKTNASLSGVVGTLENFRAHPGATVREIIKTVT